MGLRWGESPGQVLTLPRARVQMKGFFIVDFLAPSERVSKMPSPGELRTGYRQPASGAELDSGIGTNRLSTYEAKRASPPNTRGPGNRMNLEKPNLSGTSGDGWTYSYPQALT